MLIINIQILRAISVLAVLLFHLDVAAFSFGYIGVDVFFVISGYLMAVIIPKYSPTEFLFARIWRLYPALVAVVAVTLVLGYFLQLPGEYNSLSQSALSALSFQSHYYFLFNTGYFDIDSRYQPLLHTWSLGNEFTAYLIVFILLLILPKIRVGRASAFLAVASGAYTAANLFSGDVSYFDPVPRIFLFFIGYYTCTIKDRVAINYIVLAAISLFALSAIAAFYYDDLMNKAWPNFSIFILPLAVLPLILMDRPMLPQGKLQDAMVKIGDWSYSIYLWHWPIIAYERVLLRNEYTNTVEVFILMAAGIIAGAISFYVIEKRRKAVFAGLPFAAVAALFAIFTNGAEYRVPKSLYAYSNVNSMINGNLFIENTRFGLVNVDTVVNPVEGKGRLLVIGDSHSQHILPIVKSGFVGGIYRILAEPDSAVGTWNSISGAIDDLGIDTVLVAYRLISKSHKDMGELIAKLKSLNIDKVIFLRDIPAYDGDPVACLFAIETSLMYRPCDFDIRNGIPLSKLANAKNPIWDLVTGSAAGPGFHFIDSHAKLCGAKSCPTYINGELILRDNNHFNERMGPDTNKKLFSIIFGGALLSGAKTP